MTAKQKVNTNVWLKSKIVRLVAVAVLFAVAYIGFSLSIDSGRTWWYLVTAAAAYAGLRVLLAPYLFRNDEHKRR
jgi:hypothetical protein